jgi:hypothetical protein
MMAKIERKPRELDGDHYDARYLLMRHFSTCSGICRINLGDIVDSVVEVCDGVVQKYSCDSEMDGVGEVRLGSTRNGNLLYLGEKSIVVYTTNIAGLGMGNRIIHSGRSAVSAYPVTRKEIPFKTYNAKCFDIASNYTKPDREN